MSIRVADLRFLERLACILSLMAENYTGEAHWTIHDLRGELSGLDLSHRELIEEALAKSERPFPGGPDYANWPSLAIWTLSNLNGKLWPAMLEQLEGIDEITPVR